MSTGQKLRKRRVPVLIENKSNAEGVVEEEMSNTQPQNTHTLPSVTYRDLGLIDYKEAWDLQETILQENVSIKTNNRRFDENNPTTNHLLFCQHPHVYTLGKSGKKDHLLLNEEQLAARNISYYHINRGGDITYHGPGQLVGYPIFDLDQFKPDLHLYLRNLEEACILTLADYGIMGARVEGLTGVWVRSETPNPEKILAIGVRCSRWITMHGFALNVNPDLDLFQNIIPCGITDKGVTSMQKELGREVPMQEVYEKMRSYLGQIFGFELKG